MIETEQDTRAMIDQHEFADLVELASGSELFGIIDHNFAEALDVNGRRTGLRCYRSDVSAVTVNTTLRHVKTDTTYTVRAKEEGARTTLLILEQT